jgi:MFS family permease
VAAPVSVPAGVVRPGPTMLEALHEPRYRRLWLAGLCVNTARWLDTLVLGWVVLQLTDSPLMVGVAAFCRTAPMMVLGLFAGVLADRFDRGRVLLFVQSLNLGSALVLALLFGTGTGGLWQLLGLEILLGVAWVVDYPARRSVIYTLVGSRRLTNAVSLESVSMQGTKMIGPLLGGVLLARFGPTGCYLALALLFLVALLLILTLHRQVTLPGLGTVDPVIASLAIGLREARAERTVLAVLTITIVMNALVFPYQQMWPVFARDVFRVGPELLGLLIAADGLGALVGALVVAARPAG